jgi:hypothetical protein
MPKDACQIFYDCKGCGERLKPKPGDCCVFCSYGSVPCPPVQSGQSCSQGGRLSGTGPKAGGPNYLRRLIDEQVITVNVAAVGGNAELLTERG